MRKRSKDSKILHADRLYEVISERNKTPNKGYGIAQFVKDCDLPKTSIYRTLSNNTQDMNLLSLFKICKTTGVSADWLIGLSDDKMISNPTSEVK